MITVLDTDGSAHEFSDARRYSTDEHNNLEVWTGVQGDRLVALFHREHWLRVEVEDGDPSED